MKVYSSYPSILQGVSQQDPGNRLDGQCTEQVNMLPDPVHGLTRRHGSQFQAEMPLAYGTAELLDMQNYRTFTYTGEGKTYDLLIRRAERPVGSTLQPILCYDREAKQFLYTLRPLSDPALDAWAAGGCSAITSVGKYVFMAGNTTLPTAASTDNWGNTDNQNRAVLWVRGGAYSRTFKATATKTDGSTVTFEYTTPSSSYQGLLDTSGVPVFVADNAGGTQSDTEAAYIVYVGGVPKAELTWFAWSPTGLTATKAGSAMTNVYPASPSNSTQFAWAAGDRYVSFHSTNLGAADITLTYTHAKTAANPNYARIVGDLTNDYNSAVTAWIGSAAEAIQPQAIAEQLKLAAVSAGLSATRLDSTVLLPGVKALSVQDGGDGSLVRGVSNEVTSADQVSAVHYVGKVVKVLPKGSEEAFYLVARPKLAGATGWAEVTWVEGAGVSHNITSGLVYGVVAGGAFHYASSAALLATSTPGSHPTWTASTVGDHSSSPVPHFVGRKITYLGVFQDRLLVGSAGVLRASKVGDYLNFFRSSVLTVPADDAFEMLSQGNEDDVLRHSVLYDRDLVLFGDKRQYAVSGRVPLTPTNANMPVMSSHEGAADTAPVETGGLIFYAKHGESSTAGYQIEPGANAESPEAYPISPQLDTYLQSQSTELVALARPSALLMRTRNYLTGVYVFSYMDSKASGRQQAAWHRFDYGEACGQLVGISSVADGFLLFFLRRGLNSSGGAESWIVADFQPMTPSLSYRPYLDSNRPWPVTSGVHTSSGSAWAVAYDRSSEWAGVGAPVADVATLQARYPEATGLYVGVVNDGVWVPTNPVPKDNRDNAILNGRTVITRKLLAVADTGGLEAAIGDAVQVFNGRVVGAPANLVGRAPRATAEISVPIGRERREYTLTIRTRNWQPLSITAVAWVGQLFNRPPRL